VSQPSTSTRRKARKIRYHDGEWSVVASHARACGLPPATFVRKVSLGAKPRARRNRTENDLILHLGRIATDLQRLVRVAERNAELPTATHPQIVLDEVLAAIRRIG
jgi:hypothetical protein